eukprot:SAG31_NODE_4229_length_3440_cov_3.033224_7_plen_161_part_00
MVRCTWIMAIPVSEGELNLLASLPKIAGTYPPPPPPPPPPPCTPAKSTTSCQASWHCAFCRVPSSAAPDTRTDCLSCAPGYTFVQVSTDCTGHCVIGNTTIPSAWHERSTRAISVGDMAGRFLSVVATLAENKATQQPTAARCALENFTMVATLIADPAR